MISNSEKALNKMITMCVAKNFNPKEVTLEKCVETIRNDLYRLQELEQENEDLKEELELLKKKYYELKEQLSSGNL